MTDLDDLFAEGRAEGPDPSASLMARVLQDAVAEQGKFRTPGVLAAKPARISLLDRLFGLLGGAGTLAGGAMAGLAGLTLGYLQPESLANLSDLLANSSVATQSMDLMPAYDSLLTEE